MSGLEGDAREARRGKARGGQGKGGHDTARMGESREGGKAGGEREKPCEGETTSEHEGCEGRPEKLAVTLRFTAFTRERG